MDRITESIQELMEAVRRLRSPGGCSWDRSQTLKSLRPFMLEEAYEVADAVDSGDMEELKKELGDLLLHIIMSSEICREEGSFDLADVAGRITEKLKRRHPHVFQERSSLTPEEVEKQWESIKAEEKKKEKKQFFDSIPGSMPALQKAWRIQQRASEVGYPWPGREETAEAAMKILKAGDFNEVSSGKLLFLLVSLMRQNGTEPEKALRNAGRDFMNRFNRLEELLHVRGCSLHDAEESVLDDCINIAFGVHLDYPT